MSKGLTRVYESKVVPEFVEATEEDVVEGRAGKVGEKVRCLWQINGELWVHPGTYEQLKKAKDQP